MGFPRHVKGIRTKDSYSTYLFNSNFSKVFVRRFDGEDKWQSVRLSSLPNMDGCVTWEREQGDELCLCEKFKLYMHFLLFFIHNVSTSLVTCLPKSL